MELIALDDAEIKYSIAKLFPGDSEGNGGVFNFVTKESCENNAKISWTQVETGW